MRGARKDLYKVLPYEGITPAYAGRTLEPYDYAN